VLLAGSNGYYNYRHQSDVCHAFQLLTNKGAFPKENVIVMMFDDIANNDENPVKGNIINHPNGTNVYVNVNKDYTGNDVTAINFLNVLNGSASAMHGIGSGKVVNSTSDDNIFVYYTDHGAPGFVGMPTRPYLYATDVLATLKKMKTDGKFNKLVFYLEACESGSMFENLEAGLNIYATTAANPDESSYAFYYDDTRQTYLGDEYSIRWMEDSDIEDESAWTLDQQFNKVVSEVKQSHPQKYGDASTMGSENIGDYQSYKSSWFSKLRSFRTTEKTTGEVGDARDVKLLTLTNQLRKANKEDKPRLNKLLLQEITERSQVDDVFSNILSTLESDAVLRRELFVKAIPVRNFDCLKTAVETFEKSCGRFSEYGLQYARVLSNACERDYDILAAITRAC
jgi:legumain